MNSVKNLFAGIGKMVPKVGRNPILKIVIGFYVATVAGLILLYCGAWFVDWRNHVATLADLLAIIDKVTDANGLALITFIAGLFIDVNGNGIPDILEKKEGAKNENDNDSGECP